MRPVTAAVPDSASEAPATIPLRRAVVDLGRLVRSALAPLDRDCGMRDVSLELDVADGCKVSVDPDKIAWGVTMLVGNALRHVKRGTRMHPGGSIGVRIEEDAARRQVVILVHDDGPGMQTDRIRSMFERHSDAQHAPALGLSLARDIARAHGGDLEVESRTDPAEHGTTVRMTLPALR
jgi:signal transduction histidine kinase